MKIPLGHITLWACCWSDDKENLSRTIRVLHYMQRLCNFGRTVLFSYMPPAVPVKADVIQIPNLGTFDQFNIWVNAAVPYYISDSAAWAVHEDGFILDPKLWSDEFLDWDYLGAPWADGVVGNGGCSIESRNLLAAKRSLPFSVRLPERSDGYEFAASDIFICRLHKERLEKEGIRFAPRDVATRFSSEQLHQFPAMCFHGRNVVPHLYEQAWKRLEESEK